MRFDEDISDITMTFEKVIARYVCSRDRLLLAVSGGADSVGLLDLVLGSSVINPKQIVVCHCDHGLRSDSIKDMMFVKELAESRMIRCVVKRGELKAKVGGSGMSVEAYARKWRYNTLKEVADRESCAWILTGHTLEDSAETVLWKMLSGAPWYEWTGIPEQRGQIVRPLLRLHRDDIRQWLSDRGQLWITDPTNSDLRHLRNRLRKRLEEHPQFWNRGRVEQLAAAGRTIGEWYGRYRRLIRVMTAIFRYSDKASTRGVAIKDISRYFNYLDFSAVEQMWADRLGMPDARLPSSERRGISDMLRGTGPNAEIQLPGNLCVQRRGKSLWISRSDTPYIERCLEIGEMQLPELGVGVTLELVDNKPAQKSGLRISSTLHLSPLILRSWKPGDRIQLKNRPAKKISDLLREMRFSPDERNRTLVVTDKQGLIAVLGIGVAERAIPAKNDTQVLSISWTCYDRNTSRSFN